MNWIKATTIDDAWREAINVCAFSGYDFEVKGGSYKGQIRRQLEAVMIEILGPGKRPLSPILPPSVPPPTTDDKIFEYFRRYLVDDVCQQNEQYTYGSFIKQQLPRAIEILLSSDGWTNQACISVADKRSIFLPDPPCLRVISFKRINDRLNMTVYFRSWDLVVGFPENIGGLQLLKEYVLCSLESRGLYLADGSLIAFSDGLHIYEQYEDIVNLLTCNKVKFR